MKALVRNINVLLMLRIHTNYYIVCRVISPHRKSSKPGVKCPESCLETLTNYSVRFKNKAIKSMYCLLVTDPGPGNKARAGSWVVAPVPSQPGPHSLSQYQAVTWQPDTLLKTWHFQTFHKIQGNWKNFANQRWHYKERLNLTHEEGLNFCQIFEISQVFIDFKVFDWWDSGMSK